MYVMIHSQTSVPINMFDLTILKEDPVFFTILVSLAC